MMFHASPDDVDHDNNNEYDEQFSGGRRLRSPTHQYMIELNRLQKRSTGELAEWERERESKVK